jgi:phosphoglycolate phosphatase-like HAD superfamily hydrolase
VRKWFVAAAVILIAICGRTAASSAQNDPLPSWNNGATKKSITDFVAHVTAPGAAGFVPVPQRIATFDNDGTLWTEKPIYFQVIFALDRIRTMAPQHPEWKRKLPFKAAIDHDMAALSASGTKGLLEIVGASQGGLSPEEYDKTVLAWLAVARHPRFDKPYTDLVYQPMLELLDYLRSNGFKTFIASGGGADFMRAWTQKTYGIPPEQVVGSTGGLKFEMNRAGGPALINLPEVDFIDDGPGKPVGIERFIGRRPIFAFGNSDGDLQMLQWTAAGGGARFMGLVHHTDAEREYAYDRNSKVGRLDKALDEATAKGWTVVDMKKDWKTIYPFESAIKDVRGN